MRKDTLENLLQLMKQIIAANGTIVRTPNQLYGLGKYASLISSFKNSFDECEKTFQKIFQTKKRSLYVFALDLKNSEHKEFLDKVIALRNNIVQNFQYVLSLGTQLQSADKIKLLNYYINILGISNLEAVKNIMKNPNLKDMGGIVSNLNEAFLDAYENKDSSNNSVKEPSKNTFLPNEKVTKATTFIERNKKHTYLDIFCRKLNVEQSYSPEDYIEPKKEEDIYSNNILPEKNINPEDILPEEADSPYPELSTVTSPSSFHPKFKEDLDPQSNLQFKKALDSRKASSDKEFKSVKRDKSPLSSYKNRIFPTQTQSINNKDNTDPNVSKIPETQPTKHRPN